MKKPVFLWSFLILLTFNSNAQISSSTNIEIKSERGMYSKVFSKTNGEHEAILSPGPVHYKKNGVWEEIDTKIISNNTTWQNETNVIRSYFPSTISTSDKIKLVLNSGDELFIHSEKKLVLLNGQSSPTVLSGGSNNSVASVIDNTIRYPGIYTDISDEFAISRGEIKNNLVLGTLPTALNTVSSGYFGFQEIVELPLGWKIVALNATSVNSLTSSSLLVKDSSGNTVLSIPEPVFFDNYGRSSDGSNMVQGKYLVAQENTNWTINTLVPGKLVKRCKHKISGLYRSNSCFCW